MTARVIITAPADADMADILADLAAVAGSAVANKYNLLFESLYDRLADYPDSCPARPKLGAHIRLGIVLPYHVFYRHLEGDDTVTILRVIHGRRRITRNLLRGA
jgi:toxin ParE1/3/4